MNGKNTWSGSWRNLRPMRFNLDAIFFQIRFILLHTDIFGIQTAVLNRQEHKESHQDARNV